MLKGDPSKAKEKLSWVPDYDLASLVKDMMASDLKLMIGNQSVFDHHIHQAYMVLFSRTNLG